VVIAALGFAIYGPQMLIGLCGAELISPKSVGASQGILGLISYMGAAGAGIPLSYLQVRGRARAALPHAGTEHTMLGVDPHTSTHTHKYTHTRGVLKAARCVQSCGSVRWPAPRCLLC
jgi:hypothetical protein